MAMKTLGIMMRRLIRNLIEAIAYLDLSIMKSNATNVTTLDTQQKNCKSGMTISLKETR